MDPRVLQNTLDKISSTASGFIKSVAGPSSYSFGYTGPTPTPQPQQVVQAPQPSPTPLPYPTVQPQNNIDEARLRQNITNTWGSDTPILQHLPELIQAGQQLHSKAHKLMPVVLALRETQGGKDNLKPNTITGKNNIFNLRGIQNGKTTFVNYPDLNTAIFGGQNGPDTSQGLVGTLNGPIYQDYQNTGNIQDFFKHWSPPTDNNGQLSQQEENYNYILNKLMQ